MDFWFIVPAMAMATSQFVQAQPTLVPITPPPGATHAYIRGINADGNRAFGLLSTNVLLPFVWQPSTGSIPIGFPPGATLAIPTCSSSTGDTIAFSVSPSNVAFTWANGTWTPLAAVPGSIAANSTGISGDGLTVVGSVTFQPPQGSAYGRAVVWRNGQVDYLATLAPAGSASAAAVNSDGTVIVGSSSPDPSSAPGVAVRWVNGAIERLYQPPGVTDSFAQASNSGGNIIVGSILPPSGPGAFTPQPFLWHVGGPALDLGRIPNASCQATGVSENGSVVVGTCAFPENIFRCFVWTERTGIKELRSFLASFGVNSQWLLANKVWISRDGHTLAGDGLWIDTQQASWILPMGSLLSCFPNCDESTLQPVLTANDFICFFNKFAGSDPTANCDGSTGTPLLTANDFLCFMNAFASGC